MAIVPLRRRTGINPWSIDGQVLSSICAVLQAVNAKQIAEKLAGCAVWAPSVPEVARTGVTVMLTSRLKLGRRCAGREGDPIDRNIDAQSELDKPMNGLSSQPAKTRPPAHTSTELATNEERKVPSHSAAKFAL